MKVRSINYFTAGTSYNVNPPVKAGNETISTFRLLEVIFGDVAHGLRVETATNEEKVLFWNDIRHHSFGVFSSLIVPQKRRVGAR